MRAGLGLLVSALAPGPHLDGLAAGYGNSAALLIRGPGIGDEPRNRCQPP